MLENSQNKRMEQVYQDATRIILGRDTKIVVMSDCHRGCGGWNDNFAQNEKIYFTALRDYYNKGYTYIELGDGDELWENKDYRRIIQLYSHIFWLLSLFYKDNRFYMVYGNHDIQKKKEAFTRKYLTKYYYEAQNCMEFLFPGIEAQEAFVLTVSEKDEGSSIFLLHGHQGELLNDRLWRLGRWLVLHVWRPLEKIGINYPMGSTGSITYQELRPNKIERWANSEKQLTVAGHTHHAMCKPDAASFYFNSGSCIHPRCIVALEIDARKIRLVKWGVAVDSCNYMHIQKEVLSEHALS
ncbi:MAG: hypothetical protein PWP24_951 [Clostridiales bacterium]|nr:hypothetical protein [Clostridiales bacterium]